MAIGDAFGTLGKNASAAIMGFGILAAAPTFAQDLQVAENTTSQQFLNQSDDRNYFSEAVLYAKNEGGVAVYILLGEDEKKFIQEKGLPLDIFGDKLSGFLQKNYNVNSKPFVDTDTKLPDGRIRKTSAFLFILETGPYYDKDLDTDVFNTGQAQKVMGGVADLYHALRKHPE